MFNFEQILPVSDWHNSQLKKCSLEGERKVFMSKPSKAQVLVVDDDGSFRDILSLLLKAAGYGVATARHGFDALLHLRKMQPDLIVSDLNMPEMSGFEFLSVVRRRFPQIPVVAMSGAYEGGTGVPGGVLADGFYAKGSSQPEELYDTIADLIRTSAERAHAHRKEPAPVWIPRNGKDSSGIPYIVLTCTECLRSFPLSVAGEELQTIQETPCLFCPSKVRYIIDFSRGISSPLKRADKAGIVSPKESVA
jgi:CheY-like chemotaxis protein